MESTRPDIRPYHTGYLTDDLDRAIAFYEQVFGGEVLSRVSNARGEIAFIRASGFEVEIIAPADPARLAGRRGLVLDHIGYFVSDLNKAVAYLEEKGARFAGEPNVNARGDRVLFMDTACALGTKIHLTQKPD